MRKNKEKDKSMTPETMEKIPSFALDHDGMKCGLYRGMVCRGIATWDLRFKRPNGGDYITPKALHSIEHILATVLRNSDKKENIVYFGPMGCRTGFYLLTADMEYPEVLALLKESFARALTFTEVPGSRKKECGNYLEHDLQGALDECAAYLKVLEGLS